MITEIYNPKRITTTKQGIINMKDAQCPYCYDGVIEHHGKIFLCKSCKRQVKIGTDKKW